LKRAGAVLKNGRARASRQLHWKQADPDLVPNAAPASLTRLHPHVLINPQPEWLLVHERSNAAMLKMNLIAARQHIFCCTSVAHVTRHEHCELPASSKITASSLLRSTNTIRLLAVAVPQGFVLEQAEPPQDSAQTHRGR
jgi:hypothetical protein